MCLLIHAWIKVESRLVKGAPGDDSMNIQACCGWNYIWWRHDIDTLSALLVLCERNLPVTGNAYHKGPVTWNFIFVDISLKNYICRWCCNVMIHVMICQHTVRCRYNAVNFLTKNHKRHPIARPLGRGMVCLLWIQHLIDILHQFL